METNTERNFLNLIKVIKEKSTANTIFNDERLNVFPLRLQTRKRCLLLNYRHYSEFKKERKRGKI